MEREYLLIRGRLNRAGDYTPRRAGSTPVVRRWPEPTDGDVRVETVAEDGAVIREERASVRSERVCAPGEETWRVRAYIPLDERAVRVQVRRGEAVLWSARIPDAPRVRIVVEAPPTRATADDPSRVRRRAAKADDAATPGFPGGTPAIVRVETSEPAEPALASLTLVHQWGERRFRTVYIGPAVPRVEVPADALPGGRRCRLVAIYSNGIRSATTVTRPFAVPPIGPVIEITRPAPGETFDEGVPVPLEGMVQDPEFPAATRDQDRLSWQVGDVVVGNGLLATAFPLPVGEHVVTLAYRAATGRDDEGRAREVATRSVRVRVRKSKVPPADAWERRDPFA